MQNLLTDCKVSSLDSVDILHYQKISVELSESAKLMQEMDKIKIE